MVDKKTHLVHGTKSVPFFIKHTKRTTQYIGKYDAKIGVSRMNVKNSDTIEGDGIPLGISV